MADNGTSTDEQNRAGNERTVCRNCDTVLTGDFCYDCGQSAIRSRRLDSRQIIADFFERLVNLDTSFLRTLAGLTVRPGIVCREYIEGKRIRYTNPVGYFILATVVLTIVSRLVRTAAGVQADAVEEFSENWGTLPGLLLCVPMALLLWKLFPRSGYNLAENYVFTLYVLAQLSWLESVGFAPWSPIPGAADIAFTVWLLVGTAYLVFAARQFYREPALRIILRLAFAFAGSVVALIVLRIVLIPVWPIED